MAVSDAVSKEYHAPWYVYAVAIFLSMVLYWGAVWSVNRGVWWFAGVFAFLGSYGLIAFTRCVLDHKKLWEVFDPRTQSWAALCDVLLSLAVALAACTAEHRFSAHSWHFSLWWAVLSYVIGWGFSLGWQHFLDHPGYRKQGLEALIYDPAKIGHDVCTYSFLAGLVVYTCISLFCSNLWLSVAWPAPALVLAILLTWGAAGIIHDGGKLPDGSPRVELTNLHDAFNYDTWEPEPGFPPLSVPR